MDAPAGYLDLYDFRRRVFAMYRDRNTGLRDGMSPEAVLSRFRGARDELFARHPQSALDDDQKAAFTGLRYFPYNPDASVAAEVVPTTNGRREVIRISEDEIVPLEPVAKLQFEIGGLKAELTMYWINVYGGGLFLPFRDATAPEQTYGGGRYLFDTVKGSDFLELPSNGGRRRILLDFNYAYNPSCAYNYRWTCPLAPAENRLSVPIEAGELRYA